jgi:hypothetical protein
LAIYTKKESPLLSVRKAALAVAAGMMAVLAFADAAAAAIPFGQNQVGIATYYNDAGFGTAIDLYSCVGSPTQQWTMATDGSIRTGGKCMDVAGSGTTNGTRVQIYDCNNTAAQQWTYSSGRNLVNPQSGKCLDLTGNSSADFTTVQLWTCTGAANQKWSVPA